MKWKFEESPAANEQDPGNPPIEEEERGLGYLAGTIDTYNRNVERFAGAIDEKRLDIEMDEFSQLVPAGGAVLDAGCGYGRDTALLKERGYEVSGIDLAEGFVEEARRRLPDVEFRLMDVRELDFADRSFDGVWARAVLLHLTHEDMERALAEFRRVLKPGGTVFLYLKQGEGSEVKEEGFTAEGERFFSYVTEDQLKEMIEAASLTPEKVYSHNERKVFGKKFRDLWWVCAFAKKP